MSNVITYNCAMDPAALRDLFDYTDFTWASHGRSLKLLPDDALTRQIDIAGRPMLGHGLYHLASAWDGWLNGHSPLRLGRRLA